MLGLITAISLILIVLYQQTSMLKPDSITIDHHFYSLPAFSVQMSMTQLSLMEQLITTASSAIIVGLFNLLKLHLPFKPFISLARDSTSHLYLNWLS